MQLHSSITRGNRSLKLYASRLEKLGIFTFEDFLLHIPARYEDYSLVSKITAVQPGETVTLQGQVLELKSNFMRGARIKNMQKATLVDDTGSIDLVWFNQPFLTKSIPPGSILSVSGKVEGYGRKRSISSPEHEILSGQTLHTGRLIPIYHETQGVSSKWLRRQINTLLEQFASELTEYLPDNIKRKHNLMDYTEALKEIHFPQSTEKADRARERLAFDEFLLMQISANKRRKEWKQEQKGSAFDVQKFQKEIENLIASLPFKLTEAQQRAINDILENISTDRPMNRLLQGDVGSGKTVVAAVSMYAAYLNGYQSVLMAPTEILAQQHHKSIEKLLSPLGVTVDLITGSKKSIEYLVSGMKYKGEDKIQDTKYKIQNTNIVVGTHAVLSDKVQFHNLGFIAIDEQQRFGVEQRGIIRQKGNNPHLLTMTATPIPRTVALTMYGDLDLSYLNEMPHGRMRIKTWLVPPEKRTGAYDWIRKQVTETDSQIFIICPFIEQSENMQTVKAASKEYERLKTDVFPDLKLGLLHGKLKAKEKEQVLQEFRDKKFDILVATPVVEVGIDIPNATVIMIEASERFGLSQLHQLRGRVGRGDKQSYCLLFTDSRSAMNAQRLKGMETIYSGAELAELDLRLRGPGNLYGTAQHGVPKLKVASFSDTHLIQKAKHAADELFPQLSEYPALEEKVHEVTLKTVSPD